ncbi:MAG: hypothetical protein H0X01_02035 [Nitrospira sp.]|nr:hypothetical protein [Nitrospira sp.]
MINDIPKAVTERILRALMESSEAVTGAGAGAIVDGGSADFAGNTISLRLTAFEARTVFQTMIRAFAKEHGIELGEGKDGQ